MARFTARQGQYLAYIHTYRKLHRRAPSEAEIAGYFGVSPPAVHEMVIKLEQQGLITRKPGVARSIQVTVPARELPGLEEERSAAEQEPRYAAPGSAADRRRPGASRLYTLEVFILGGPVSEKFAGKKISRTIQIRGDQTLADLHQAIFDAFERFDPHLYEFQFGKGPHDPAGVRYGIQSPFAPEYAGDVTTATLDSLGLVEGQAFGYWFDFGDDWWHQINVEAIEDAPARGRFPRVAKRVGPAPPQYPDEQQ